MSAIIVRPVPWDVEPVPADYMPFSSRAKVAREINRLWEEFVNEMHDGPTTGPEVADKFWKYVLAGG